MLEVGAGIGSTTEIFCSRVHDRWVCLEPDPILAKKLKVKLEENRLPKYCSTQVNTLIELNSKHEFDSVIYIDVLEHIQNDQLEIHLAAQALKSGGFLVVLAPAHQYLFTPFDEAIGHYRRYDNRSLSSLIPDNLRCVNLNYLDSVGLMASLYNRLILKSKMPTQKQVKLWDKVMIPMSIKIDPLIKYSVGKSILGIWVKEY